MNAYASVYGDIRRKNTQVKNNTYITSANSQALQDNFGDMIKFPKPPRLNTLTDGDDIYRFILLSLFQNFLSGSTVATMDNSLNQVLSLLAIDDRTDEAVLVSNYSQFRFDSTSIELSDRAVQASGGNILGTATASDFEIAPSGQIFIYDYNDANKTISFSGTVNTGVTYNISYFRDNANYQDTNWMNLADRNVLSPSPMNLLAGDVSTYNNPEFSYWWNTYNVDGSGVVIDEFKITADESPLIFRLPSESVTFKNPYTSAIVTNSIDVYNLSGTAFDINIVSEYNPDIEFSDAPQNYQTDVSGKYQNYYVRYSENNSYNYTALAKYNGSFTKYTKKLQSIEFPSNNRGTLDFFEKNTNFDINDLFGTGTKHIWLDVAWDPSGKYLLDNSSFLERSYSLHQDLVWREFFEQDNNTRVYYSAPSGIRVTEAPPSTLEGKEDCLGMFSTLTGTSNTESLYAYPIVSSGITSYANHLEVDFYDNLNNSGTTSFVDVFRNGDSGQYYQFRFGVDSFASTNIIPSGSSSTVSGVNVSTNPKDTFDSVLMNSKNYGFVESYFYSSGSTNYAISGTASYTLVSGNPNTNYSTTSLLNPSNIVIYPNLASASITSSDYFLFDFTFTQDTTTAFEFNFTDPSQKIGNLYPKTKYVVDVTSTPSSSFWTFTKTNTSPGGVPVSSTFQSNIPVETGNNTFEMLKGSYLKINGVVYSGQNNPIDEWVVPFAAGAGNGGGGGAGGTVGSYKSFAVTLNDVAGDILVNHYVLGNYSLRQNYINTVYNQISMMQNASAVANLNINSLYYYQIANAFGVIDNSAKNYITTIPRSQQWHTLTFDFGTNYSNMIFSLDENIIFEPFNSSIGFSGNFSYPIAMTVNHTSNQPYTDMSFYDNIEFSYYDANSILYKYRYQTNANNSLLAPVVTNNDVWEGSALSVSTVIDNKFFQSEPVSNFQFNVNILGLDEGFIYIVNDIINRVKPAHTLVVPIYLLEQKLSTTTQSINTDSATDWETGNEFLNIQVVNDGTGLGDSAGLIRISGLAPSGT
jgi:hypothetical protein